MTTAPSTPRREVVPDRGGEELVGAEAVRVQLDVQEERGVVREAVHDRGPPFVRAIVVIDWYAGKGRRVRSTLSSR